MAQRYFTLPVKDADFPMLSEQQPRTIIGGSESTDAGAPAASGSPSLAYIHNMMPSMEGLDSVGYLQVAAPYDPATIAFSDVRVVYGSGRSRSYLAFATDGSIYVFDAAISFWVLLTETYSGTPEDVTVATVNGISYIYYSKVGCVLYNEAAGTLDSVTLTGIATSVTLGVVASYGYLIAYTASALAWSSTVDPTDFTPSAATGAGGGNVAGIGGEMLFCLANSLGFLIYTETNTIAATYTGNVKYPFKFREVDNSKGGISLDFVAYEANSAAQFVYSKAGLQSLTSQKADTILPMITDFLAGKRFEDFDEGTKVFSTTDLTSTMKKKLKFIASRYLIVSYGVTSYTHALVYDTALKRLGKLKLDHVDCFEYVGSQKEVSKESIAFLLASGEVSVLDFSATATGNGVALFGRLQYTRGKMITLQGVEVENVESTSTLAVSSLVSLDGKTTVSDTAGTELVSVNNLRKYGFIVTGSNHSILLIGKMNLTTLFIIYILAGRR